MEQNSNFKHPSTTTGYKGIVSQLSKDEKTNSGFRKYRTPHEYGKSNKSYASWKIQVTSN